jgi:multicomponent Na+:H+ antiporter subunit E
MSKLKEKLEFSVWLFIFWLLFTLELDLWNILVGIVISIVITAVSFESFYSYFSSLLRISKLFTVIKYVVRLIYDIYKSSFINMLRIIKKDHK